MVIDHFILGVIILIDSNTNTVYQIECCMYIKCKGSMLPDAIQHYKFAIVTIQSLMLYEIGDLQLMICRIRQVKRILCFSQ